MAIQGLALWVRVKPLSWGEKRADSSFGVLHPMSLDLEGYSQVAIDVGHNRLRGRPRSSLSPFSGLVRATMGLAQTMLERGEREGVERIRGTMGGLAQPCLCGYLYV
jgi:hypothetical protein